MHIVAYILIGNFCFAAAAYFLGEATRLTWMLHGVVLFTGCLTWYADTHREEDQPKHVPFKEKLRLRQG